MGRMYQFVAKHISAAFSGAVKWICKSALAEFIKALCALFDWKAITKYSRSWKKLLEDGTRYLKYLLRLPL